MGFLDRITRRASAAALLALAFSGCATYDSYYADSYVYRDEGYTYREPARGGDYYYGERYYDDYDYDYGYRVYSSAVWPSWRVYDPWYGPTYYGLGWYPRSSFGFGLGYGYGYGHRYYDPWWGYGGYAYYAPYRHGWRRDDRDNADRRYWRPERPDGSYRRDYAADEAERLANRRGAGTYGGQGASGSTNGRVASFPNRETYRSPGAIRSRDGDRYGEQRYGGDGYVGGRRSGYVTNVPPASAGGRIKPDDGGYRRGGSTEAYDAYRSRSNDRDASYGRAMDRGYGHESYSREPYAGDRPGGYSRAKPAYESAPSVDRGSSTPSFDRGSSASSFDRGPAFSSGGSGGRERSGGRDYAPRAEAAPRFDPPAPRAQPSIQSAPRGDYGGRGGGRGRDGGGEPE